uniref:Reverse transcriptase domain-containing protein n=1 Tax=Tanacetum cinerariifolium TaxID=118510 RepID=A0A6L2KB43_TANCI|nr:reverse transcriptase domain-containing protein [Tanacetum cinerariifolium]
MEHPFELTNTTPPTPHDSPLTGGYTPGSNECRLKLEELMDTYTTLSNRVTTLEDELSSTKAVYHKAFITLTKRVNVDIEDSPKGGRLIEELDKDEDVNLLDKWEKDIDKGDQRKEIDWNDPTVLRYHALQNRPFSKAEVRKNMVMYLKNQGGYKHSYFKGIKLEDIRPIFERLDQQTKEEEEEVEAQVDSDQEVEQLIQKLPGDQKCMKKVENSSRSKATKDIISIGSFVKVLVLNHYVLIRKMVSLSNIWIGSLNLYVSVAIFQRPNQSNSDTNHYSRVPQPNPNPKPTHPNPNPNNTLKNINDLHSERHSFAFVVHGNPKSSNSNILHDKIHVVSLDDQDLIGVDDMSKPASEKVKVEVDVEIFKTLVHEIGTWCINIMDESLDLSSTEDENDIEKFTDTFEDYSVDDLDDVIKNLNNDKAYNETNIEPPNVNVEDSQPGKETSVSDLSFPPGFKHLKMGSSSRCSTSFARRWNKDIKDISLIHELSMMIEVGNSLGRNRRCSKQKIEEFNLDELSPPIVMMADQRSMAQLLQAPIEGYEDAIVFPTITADNFELKHGLLTLRFDESFSEAWDRFKDLLRACPHHGFSKLHQLDTFYNALNSKDQDSLNSFAGVSTNTSTSGISPDVAELKDMVKALLLGKKSQNQAPATMKAVKKSCVTCGGAHSYRNCPATDRDVYHDNIQEFVSQAFAFNYNQGNTSYRPSMMSNQIRPPAYQALAPQTQSVSKEDFSVYVKANDAVMRNMQTQGQNMQNQLTILTDLLTKFMNSNNASTSSSGTLPSNTIANPRSNLKAITTRSGVSYDGPQIPSPPSFLPKVVENKPEVTKDTINPTNNGSTEDVQPPVVQSKSRILTSEPVNSPTIEPVISPVSAPRPNQRPSIPYPSRMQDKKLSDKANDQHEKIFPNL